MTAEHDRMHERMEDAVAAYVLGACDDEEEVRLVEAHMVACPTCRALARRLAPAVDALALATDEARPSDRLRAGILAAAAAAPQRSDEEPAPPARVATVSRPARRRGGTGTAGGGWPRGRLALYRGAVAALAVALIALAAVYVTSRQQGGAPTAPLRYPLVGTGAMAGASGTFTEVTRQDAAVVALTGMPQPPAGRVYELWLIDSSNRAIPSGVFVPGPDGTVTLGVSHALAAVRSVAVTQEAAPRGATAPTQKPELAGEIGG
jgi:hypothetical protein